MFVKITDGNRHYRVSEGAFNAFYKWNGFVIEPDEELHENFDAVSEEEKEGVENFFSIPLTEMTNKQLREYAEFLGIDLTGVKSAKQAREKIAQKQREQ